MKETDKFYKRNNFNMWLHTNINRAGKAVSAVVNRLNHSRDVYYIVEGADWVIDHVGRSITTNLRDVSSAVVTSCRGIRNSVVHFGSINTFMAGGKLRLPHCISRWYCSTIDLVSLAH